MVRYDNGMTTRTYTTTYDEDKCRYPKGSLVQASVEAHKTIAYGIRTEWAVVLTVASPTGDSSDFFHLPIPCLSLQQACDIADDYNRGLEPRLVGVWYEQYAKYDEQMRVS
jgi:hypothetical protein